MNDIILCSIKLFGDKKYYNLGICKIFLTKNSATHEIFGLMFFGFFTEISINIHIMTLQMVSVTGELSVDTKKYHICHVWNTWKLNFGLMYVSF